MPEDCGGVSSPACSDVVFCNLSLMGEGGGKRAVLTGLILCALPLPVELVALLASFFAAPLNLALFAGGILACFIAASLKIAFFTGIFAISIFSGLLDPFAF